MTMWTDPHISAAVSAIANRVAAERNMSQQAKAKTQAETKLKGKVGRGQSAPMKPILW